MRNTYDLITAIMAQLSDNDNSYWSRAHIAEWLTQAVQEYSTHLPRILTATASCEDDTRTYSLPTWFLDIISVEYPTGEDPPTMLSRGNRITDQGKNGLYDIIPAKSASFAQLWLSGSPASGESIGITYKSYHDNRLAAPIESMTSTNPILVTWTDHRKATGDNIRFAGITQEDWSDLNGDQEITRISDNTFTVDVDGSGFASYDADTDPGYLYGDLTPPEEHHHILTTYAVYLAQMERLNNTLQSPESSTLLITQMSAIADRSYRKFQDMIRSAVKQSSVTVYPYVLWKMDTHDRIY